MSDQEKNIILYNDGEVDTALRLDSETQSIWATVQNIAELFGVERSVATKHINNIYKEGELDQNSTSAKIALVQNESGRMVVREILHYNLDVILSVGYRVNSRKATIFRKWASNILKAYMEQGYAINEQVLRDSPDKLNELAAKIRALRSEEKQIYAKVRECFKLSSSDYDPSSRQVKTFYALLQDKFHHAITGMTSSKLLLDRADHLATNMGLYSIKGDFPTLQEVKTGKNYLDPKELYRIHILSEQFLLYAESTALAGKKMTMESLHKQLDKLLILNDYPVFDGYIDYIKDKAVKHAEQELDLYRKRKQIESLGYEYDEELLAAGEYDYLLDDLD